MSIMGYLSPNRRLSFIEQRSESLRLQQDTEKLPGGLERAGGPRETCAEPDDYDPVLRWHCRLEEF